MSDEIKRHLSPDHEEDNKTQKFDGNLRNVNDLSNDDTNTISLEANNSVNVVLKIGLINAHSILDVDRRVKLHSLIKRKQFDILFVTETWETSATSEAALNELPPTAYSALHCPRPVDDNDDQGPHQGGGLAVIHRNNITVQRTSEAITAQS